MTVNRPATASGKFNSISNNKSNRDTVFQFAQFDGQKVEYSVPMSTQGRKRCPDK